MICKVFRISRASFCRVQKKNASYVRQRPGPGPPVSDDVLRDEIRGVIRDPDFLDCGYRPVWSVLRFDRNLMAGQKRTQKMMQRHNWQRRIPHRGAPRGHREGTVAKPASNMMRGTDGTRFWTVEDGWCRLFPVIDHHDREIIGHRASKEGTAGVALDAFERPPSADTAPSRRISSPALNLKLDHGSRNTPHLFMDEAKWPGFDPAFTYVGNPRGNAIAERVIGTIKKECIRHHRFKNLAEAEKIITAFVERYNTKRQHGSLGYRTPA